jgi:hypothetical protein
MWQAALLASGAMACASCIAAVGTNFSDHWWSPGEPGWGAAIQQQSDLIFVQVLVYRADGSAAWYIASASKQAASAAGHSIFSGDLYRTRGPVGSVTFDPAAISTDKAGALTFDADTADTATLTYTIDGVMVAKPVTRLTWKLEDLSGEYYGGFVYDFAPAHGPCVPGHFEDLGPLSITRAGASSVVMTVAGNSRSCTFTGDYLQLGHMGTSHGTFVCTQGGQSGTYTANEIEKSEHGIAGRIVGDTTLCQFEGSFGGVRR